MSRPSPLAVEHATLGAADLLRLSGELDLTNADGLPETVAGTGSSAVVLDLALLTFLDSAGIRALDRAHSRLRGAGRTLVIVAPPSSRAALTLRVAGLEDGVVVGSLDAAKRRIDAVEQG